MSRTIRGISESLLPRRRLNKKSDLNVGLTEMKHSNLIHEDGIFVGFNLSMLELSFCLKFEGKIDPSN
jgi:hypothetical protein